MVVVDFETEVETCQVEERPKKDIWPSMHHLENLSGANNSRRTEVNAPNTGEEWRMVG